MGICERNIDFRKGIEYFLKKEKKKKSSVLLQKDDINIDMLCNITKYYYPVFVI